MTRRGICLLILGVFTAVSVSARPAGVPPAPGSGPLAGSGSEETQNPNDAEKLFRQMEAVFVKAKTLEMTCEGTFEGTFRGKLKGSLVCTTGNRSREEIDGDLAFGPGPKKAVTMRMTTDGTRMAMTTDLGHAPQNQTLDVPAELGAAQRLFTARAGILAPTFLLAENVPSRQKPTERKPAEHIRVRDFRFGKPEKLGRTGCPGHPLRSDRPHLQGPTRGYRLAGHGDEPARQARHRSEADEPGGDIDGDFFETDGG